jgi:hypothetical protein
MSGPKHFTVRLANSAIDRVARQERLRADAIKSETDRILAELRMLEAHASSRTGAEPSTRTSLGRLLSDVAALPNMQNLYSVSAELQLRPIELSPALSERPALSETTVGNVFEQARAHVEEACAAELNRVQQHAQREFISGEIREVLAEMGFDVSIESRGARRAVPAAPVLVASRGSEKVSIALGLQDVTADWSENPGSDCQSGREDLSRRLSSRGIDLAFTGLASTSSERSEPESGLRTTEA